MDVAREKRLAAEASAHLVEDGMCVGLGTGSTVREMLPVLAARHLDLRCIATSPATARIASDLGLPVESFEGPEAPDRLDIAIDGADQVDDDGWIVKGGGGAHTREKRVAASADRFVVIVSSDKLVERIRAPVPLELLPFGLAATLRDLAPASIRDLPPSPDGGVIADYEGGVGDPGELSARFAATPGVIEHGLFPPSMVSEVIVAIGDDVQHRRGGKVS